MDFAKMYIADGYCIKLVLLLCEVPRSTYYHTPKPPETHLKKGIANTLSTIKKDGTIVDNCSVVEDIKTLLTHEFVDYGYNKVTYYLQDERDYVINKKKVYRLMKEAELLNKPVPKQKNKKTWVKELVPQPTEAFSYWEFDIKFIYIHHLGRYAPMLSVIDVYSRYLVGWLMQWSIKKEDVVGFFDALLSDYNLPEQVWVRCDNGSQFESNLVRDYFEAKGIDQEFTKPATPEQNAHIESYHSIISNAVCRRFEFESLENATEVFGRWQTFYNAERIHSGIGFTSPEKFLLRQGEEVPKKIKSKKDELAA
jgi:transposase InsO family protein